MKMDFSPTYTSDQTALLKDILIPMNTDGPGKEILWFSEAEVTKSPASSSTPGVTVISTGEQTDFSWATKLTDGDTTLLREMVD